MTHFSYKNTHRLRVKRWKEIFQTNGNLKKGGVAKVITDKIDFKLKKAKRTKKS